jgi:Ca2+-binding EF-hand superfamily protein
MVLEIGPSIAMNFLSNRSEKKGGGSVFSAMSPISASPSASRSRSPGVAGGAHQPPPARMNSFNEVVDRLEKRVEKIQLGGRYHKPPIVITDHYEVASSVLGSGCNGDVRLATRKDHPEHRFAVKAFDFASVPDTKRAQLESEVEVFLNMDHPHIARLMDVYMSEEHLDLIMECMDGGELFDRMKSLKRFPQREAAEVTWQMLLALNYIHEHGIMHGDIKLENFMFDSMSSNHLKLIDFGFSKMCGQVAEKVCGTVAYIAPEVLDLNFTPQADMWSLGVIVFCMLSGYMPFTGSEQNQLQNIVAGKYSMKKEKWGYLSKEAVEFTRCLLKVDPKKRLTAQQSLEHPFISNKHFGNKLQVDSTVVEAMCDFGHHAKFRRCCLFIMAWSLSSEERAAVEEYFLAMDEHHHGALTYEDLKHLMVDKFKVPAKEVKTAFQALAVHSDKEIHYSDFLAAMVSTRIALNNDILQDCFQKFDLDSNGFITRSNLRDVLGDKFNGIPVEQLFDDVPTLHEGKMSWHEFVCFMKGKPLKLHGDEFVPDQDSEGDLRKNRTSRSGKFSFGNSKDLQQHPALVPQCRPAAGQQPHCSQPACGTGGGQCTVQ